MCADARTPKTHIHSGRVFGIGVERCSELPANDPRRQFNHRVIFQGHHVTDQKWEWAIFQDLGSNPASMHAGRVVDSYAGFPAHCCQQSDADQAYAQAWLKGIEMWIVLPCEAWPPEWFYEDGSPMYDQPVIQLLRALYGHPDAGTFWEQHCDEVLVKKDGCRAC